MYRQFQTYAWNGRVKAAKTADYTVLSSDEELNVTPTANTTLTLPLISTLAADGFGGKAYKISKEGTGRYWVKIAPTSPNTINGGQGAVFLFARGDEVIIQSTVTGDWDIATSSVRSFVDMTLEDNKFENISIRNAETGAAIGQINGMEISMASGDGSAALSGSMSYTTMRMVNHIIAASGVMTARTAFFGLYQHLSTGTPFSGNICVAEFEVGNAYVSDGVTTSILTLCTRGAVQVATHHNLSAYITIRDYTTSEAGTGSLPNIFSLAGGSALTWTIPAASTANKTDLFCAHHGGTENVTHYLKFSVAGTSYWIHCDSVGPAAS